jgi:hypothetical protein
VIPAWRGDAGRGQEEIEDRLGLCGYGHHLAAKEPPERSIRTGGLIHRRDMNQLVVHDDVHAVVAGDRFESEAEGRDLRHHRVVRHDARAGVPGVLEVGEQQRDAVGGIELEQAALKRQRVQEGARGVRHEKRFGRVEVDEPKLRGFNRTKLSAKRRRGRKHCQRCCTEEASHGARVIAEATRHMLSEARS